MRYVYRIVVGNTEEQRLRKRGAIPQFPHTSPWCSGSLSTDVFIVWYLVKQRGNFSFNSDGEISRGVLVVDRGVILKWILKKLGVRVWTGFIWLRIGASDGLL
jgi:hypothetical protein